MGRKDAETIRVTITIEKAVYEGIRSVSKKMGISPSTWITMICTTRINDLMLSITSKK